MGIPRICGNDLTKHLQGDAFATSYRGPWKLIYYEAYLEQADALGRERYLKSAAGRRFLKAQLTHYLRKAPIRSIREEYDVTTRLGPELSNTPRRRSLYVDDLRTGSISRGIGVKSPLD